jgi:acetyl-CoA carboxylase biotin carboxyl carrier protein
MTPEELSELKELVEFLKENEINEFDFERGEFKVRLKFAQAVQAIPAPAFAQQIPTAAPQGIHAVASTGPVAVHDPPADDPQLHIVKSPIVGTFYESSSPGAPAFIKIGDEVENGQVLCIVEAMKLMNEIESDAAGEVVKRWVTNGQPVEYGQSLFSVRLK